eukprot:2676280-Pyramimonas_sp.AAC.1
MIRSTSQSVGSNSARELLECIAATAFTDCQKQTLSDAVEGKLIESFKPETLGPPGVPIVRREDAQRAELLRAVRRQHPGRPDHRGGMYKPSPPTCADAVAMLAGLAWHDNIDATGLYEC